MASPTSSPSSHSVSPARGGGNAGKLGLGAIILLGINGIIGSGAFLLPQQIYKDAGFLLGLVTLLVSGIATLFIVFAYADLAGKVPGSGGGWLYCYTAWGRFTGFQVGMFVWFAGIATIATEVAALIRVFKPLIPDLGGRWLSWGIGCAVILVLALINLFGAQLVKIVDNVSSGAKIATALFLVIVGAFFLKVSNFDPLLPTPAHGFGGDFDAVKTAYGVTFYLFAGFSFLTIAGGKMKNSQKNLPKALLIVIGSVTVIYLAMQSVTVGILGTKTADSAVPVADAMHQALGEWAYYVVIAGTAVSVLGVAFACSFEVPVVVASLANGHKLLPAWMGKTNKHGSPYVAIAITAAFAMAMLATGDYVFLATLVVCASAIQYVPTILAVIKLRKRPSASGSFQLKGWVRWLIVCLALLVSAYLFFSFDWEMVAMCAGVFALGLIIYFLDRRRRQDPTQAVDPLADRHDPVATRAGTAVIDSTDLHPATQSS